MADLGALVAQMTESGDFVRVGRNVRAQFGTATTPYLGAQLLPERFTENAYTEDEVNFRTTIANDGSRYAPTQKKGTDIAGTMDVRLGHSDIARELTGRDYDILINLLSTAGDLEAIARIIRWADITLNRALLDLAERHRWDAIINGVLERKGDHGYKELVNYADPAGHRVTVAGSWSDPTYDPFSDIFAAADLLESKGYTVGRIITTRTPLAIMAQNELVRTRTSRVALNAAGQLQGTVGRVEAGELNAVLGADGLPGITSYNRRYSTQTGQFRYIPDDCMVLVGTTERNEDIALGDGAILPVPQTLGYYAIGRAVGQSTQGRVLNVFPKYDKPPRLDGEAYMASLPVIQEPEAFVVLKGIN